MRQFDPSGPFKAVLMALVIAVVAPATGQAGIVAFGSSTPFDFGNVPVNTQAVALIDVAVDAGYSVNSVSFVENSQFGFDFDTCGGGFAGPGDCTIKETFQESSFGLSSLTVSLFECPIVGGFCRGGTLLLSATTVSVFSAHPNPVDFGNVVLGETSSMSIGYTVDAGYRIGAAEFGFVPFSFDFGTCGAIVGFAGPGDCAVQGSFTPNAAGPASGTLTLFECPAGGGVCPGATADVLGVGVNAPEPGTLAMLGMVLAGWLIKRRRKG
jgi:hypothetical protein